MNMTDIISIPPSKNKNICYCTWHQAKSKSQKHVEAWVVFHSTDTGTWHYTLPILHLVFRFPKEQLDLVHYHSCLYYINISQ